MISLLTKKTKIVATLGPATASPEILEKLLTNGANVIRLNFSHGEQEIHKKSIEMIREISAKLGIHVGILADIKGPKIRAGEFKEDTQLIKGNNIIIQKKEIIGTKDSFSISYPGFIDDANINDTVMLDDGNLNLTIIDKDSEKLICRIENDGIMKSRKGVGLPGKAVNIEFMSDKDRSDLEFIAQSDVNFIAASFIRNKSDLASIREVLAKFDKHNTPIISKIETQMAVDNIDEIIEYSDGIMVARGDLGIDLPLYKVPIVQKMIIKKCNLVGKPVITATQMLESMIENPRATRAEISDVANAILDGTDAVMLSGESAVGKYPVEAVATMNEIASHVEQIIDYHKLMSEFTLHVNLLQSDESTAFSVVHAANNINAKLIVAATQSGKSAKLISKYRPSTNIVALCPNSSVAQSLSLYSGVISVVGSNFSDMMELIDESRKVAVEKFSLKPGDSMITVGGIPIATSKTNFMKITEL
ncbi:MAG: pyruvate kinase [Leptotrichiaceae bacterium]